MDGHSIQIADRDIRPLVQAPMESPLNMAHTYSRKADMLAKSKKYDEAIDCHRRAAEYLLQAMNMTKSPTLLGSMALQHKVYLSQIDRLYAKSQLLELVDRSSKTITTVSRATQTDDIYSVDDSKPTCAVDEGTVCQILRENDDLMNKISNLSSKTQDNEGDSDESQSHSPFITVIDNTDHPDLHPLAKSILSQKQGSVNGSTLFKSEEELSLEAVLKMNSKLSATVKGMFKELQAKRVEKQQVESSENKLHKTQEGTLEFSSFDLPPLEESYPELGTFTPRS